MEKVAQSWGQSARAALNFSTGGVLYGKGCAVVGAKRQGCAELFHRRGLNFSTGGGSSATPAGGRAAGRADANAEF
jgi:hypothetical protein